MAGGIERPLQRPATAPATTKAKAKAKDNPEPTTSVPSVKSDTSVTSAKSATSVTSVTSVTSAKSATSGTSASSGISVTSVTSAKSATSATSATSGTSAAISTVSTDAVIKSDIPTWTRDSEEHDAEHHSIIEQPKKTPFNNLTTDDEYNNWLQEESKVFADRYHQELPNTDDVKYTPLRKLGEGGFGLVFLTRKEPHSPVYAMKAFSKAMMVERDMVSYITAERRILSAINHPLIISLVDRYKDATNIYMILPWVECGNLYDIIYKSAKRRLDMTHTRFYSAQVYLALEYLHSMNVVYRDLKPENIMMDKRGYVKLVDLGFAKLISPPDERTYTKLGTPAYMAPEVFHSFGYGFSVDWWAFGCLIFEFLVGKPPFYVNSKEKLFVQVRQILHKPLEFPTGFNKIARSIVASLLAKDATRRLGCLADGMQGVKKHEFFSNIDFVKIFSRRVKPPFVPDKRTIFYGSRLQPGDIKMGGSMVYESYFKNF